MTKTTEQKAVELLNEVRAERGLSPISCLDRRGLHREEAICRALEREEALRKDMSDALYAHFGNMIGWAKKGPLNRFILPEPVDPLDEVVKEVAHDLHITGASSLHTIRADEFRVALRAAIEKRGGKIVWEEG